VSETTDWVRGRVEPHTGEDLRLTAPEGMSGAAAAEWLGLKALTVSKAHGKVPTILRDEVARLEAP
jgi:RNA polymerase sigma-70 factor (ECF subfamily)